jgi:hypothetical protein
VRKHAYTYYPSSVNRSEMKIPEEEKNKKGDRFHELRCRNEDEIIWVSAFRKGLKLHDTQEADVDL